MKELYNIRKVKDLYLSFYCQNLIGKIINQKFVSPFQHSAAILATLLPFNHFNLLEIFFIFSNSDFSRNIFNTI